MTPIHLTPVLVLTSLAHATPQGIAAPTAAQREARFEALLSGSTLVGKFTITGSKKPPQADRYTLAKVEKIGGTKWRFHAKVEYGERSVTVPIVVDVLWAGDTPVIQVTDLGVPMLGTYTARVAFHGEMYAGMWSGKDHGGHMFGRVERAAKKRRVVQSEAAPKDELGWPSWRGPDGTAIARSGNPPIQWSETKNIRWKVPLPGQGASSPIVWRDRVYVTSAVETDTDGPQGQRPMRAARGFGGGAPPTKVYDFVVLAYDRKDGHEVWRKKVVSEVPHEGAHATATHASNSSLTDGSHLYAFFGSRGLHCLDLEGNIVWSKQLGHMRTSNSFGEGSSPALWGDKLVVNWDHEGESFIAAFDKRTGAELWRKARREGTTWATPLVVEVDGRAQVIVPGSRASIGYDLDSGDEVWRCSGLTRNAIPTPLHRDGVAYLMTGFRGSALQAIKLSGAKGRLDGGPQVLWQHDRETSYTPTGLVYDDLLYFLRVNNGVLSCLDAKSGKVWYEGQKLRRIGTVYSSIVGAAGRIYVTSRRAKTSVVKVGKTFEELATNNLDDTVDATAAIVGDEIFMRGRRKLYCIAETR